MNASGQNLIKKNMRNEPVIIPQKGKIPFMMGFAKAPDIKVSAMMGGGTYMGTTSCQGGETGDYADDDA